MAEALLDVDRYASAFEILEDGQTAMDMLASLCREVPVAGKQVHDANIVATMLAHGERRLPTFNVKDFRRFGASGGAGRIGMTGRPDRMGPNVLERLPCGGWRMEDKANAHSSAE